MRLRLTLRQWLPRGRGERGSQLIEFALLAPVFAIVVMGALDGGRLLGTYVILKNAAREAALYAAYHTGATDDQLETVALQEGNSFLSASKMTVSSSNYDWTYQNTKTQTARVVQVSYSFDFVNPVLRIASPLTLQATAAASLP